MRGSKFGRALLAVALGLPSALIGSVSSELPAAATASCPTSIFGNVIPHTPSEPDGNAVELGVKFRTRGAVEIIGLRFYKGTANTGVHVGHLWTGDGSFLLKTVSFTNETTSGWQEAHFDSPIFPTAGTTLVASYFAPNGGYADQIGGLASGAGNLDGPVYALADGVGGANGVFQYGGGFPANGYYASNYFVDVVVNDAETPSVPSGLWSPSQTPASVSLSWSRSVEGPGELTTGVAHHLIYRDGVLIATVSGDTISYTDFGVMPSTAHTYSVRGQNYCGTLSPASTVVVTTPARANTIFGDQVPHHAVVYDPQPVELGVKFQTRVAGAILGVRFYRGEGNPAGYIVNLWTSAGTQLASASVGSDDTQIPGWREARFFTPVPVVPGTTYVASYSSSTGHYAHQIDGLNNEIVSGNLTALANGASGPNGVYIYGGGFPTNGFYASNYWVDVEFKAAA